MCILLPKLTGLLRFFFQREFDKFGRVDDVFITGKGYAFVTMEDIEDAKDAIKELNGATIDGQEVKVEWVRKHSLTWKVTYSVILLTENAQKRG